MTDLEYAEHCKAQEDIVNNHQKIAEEIWEIENASFQQKKEWILNDVKSFRLCDGIIWMKESDDHMLWYLWQVPYDQVKSFWKCVPKMYQSKRDIARILKAQHWSCI